jgi:hypothetical protein
MGLQWHGHAAAPDAELAHVLPPLQLFSSGPQPAWWPLDKWQVSTLRRRRSELEKVYAAVQAQRRKLLGLA